MKTHIGNYKKPRTSMRLGMMDVVNLEMVLSRHISREFKQRNNPPKWSRGWFRMDIREAVKALRTIKSTQLEYNHVD